MDSTVLVPTRACDHLALTALIKIDDNKVHDGADVEESVADAQSGAVCCLWDFKDLDELRIPEVRPDVCMCVVQVADGAWD